MPAAPALPEGLSVEGFNEIKGYLLQWRFGSPNGVAEVKSTQRFAEGGPNNFNLYNAESKVFLQWERQTLGINLGWTDHGDESTARKVARWFVLSATGSADAIKYGEVVALGYGTEPSFYRYARRSVGINLENLQAPAFEWKIIGGTPGTPVKTGEMVAIYNTRVETGGQAGDFLVRHYRDAGGNIGWTTSPDGHLVRNLVAKFRPDLVDLAKLAILA